VERGKFFPGAFDRPNRETGKTTLSTQKQKSTGTKLCLVPVDFQTSCYYRLVFFSAFTGFRVARAGQYPQGI